MRSIGSRRPRPPIIRCQYDSYTNQSSDKTDQHPKLAIMPIFWYTYLANPAVEERQTCTVSHLIYTRKFIQWNVVPRACQSGNNAQAKPTTHRRDSLEAKQRGDRESKTHLSSTSTFAPRSTAFSNKLVREPRSNFATSTAPLHTYRSACSSGTRRLQVASSPHKDGSVMGMPEAKSSASC